MVFVKSATVEGSSLLPIFNLPGLSIYKSPEGFRQRCRSRGRRLPETIVSVLERKLWFSLWSYPTSKLETLST